MSLITLSSKSKDDIVQQAPFNFKNHFAQPIIIHPNSQVALLNFYHYRDDGYYRITSNNNIIAFSIGPSDQVGYHYARVASNRYENGSDLANAIAVALNEALVQQNYTFTVAFVLGNPLANPIVFDKFTISYANVAAPNSKGGSWSRLADEVGNELVIVNSDVDNNQSTIQPKVGQTADASAMMRRGVLTHEGTYRVTGIAKLGDTFDASDLTKCTFGLVRNSFSKLGNANPVANFDEEFADLRIDVRTNLGGEHIIEVSNLQQQQGTTNIMAENGKKQKLRRRLTKDYINANFNNEDLMGFEIRIVSTNRSAFVQLLKSTNGGTTYTLLPDDTGALNSDGKRNVYSQTIGGVVYGGIIYNSAGIQDGQGGNPIESRLNMIAPKLAPFIPFSLLDEARGVVKGATMDNALFRSRFATETENFTMKCNHNSAGKLDAYSFALDIESAQTTDGLVTAQQLNGFGCFKDTADIRGLTFKVHASKTAAPDAENLIGTLTLSSVTNLQGTELLGTLTGVEVSDNFIVTFTTNPVVQTEAWKLSMSGVFNHSLRGSQFTSLGLEKNNDTSDHLEALHETQGELGVKVGADLPAPATFLLNRLNQNDMATVDGVDPTGTPSFLRNDLPSGTIGPTIGFRQNYVPLLSTVTSLAGDAETTKIASDQNIHISIPELSGVKSFEGESNNTAKTIKVLPKNEFTSNDDTGSMTYSANYEDYIDINNADHLQLNELTVQVRNPDGTMAISLQPTTRATIKIRENPSVQENKRFEMMAKTISQRQDTGKDLVQGSKFVGS